jgi:photosystem II stability/assembly factor-like uncharacterized protein
MNPADPAILYATSYSTSTIGTLTSTDGGKNWQMHAANDWAFGRLWHDDTSLAVDPVDSTTLYAASSAGTLKSADRGATWVRTASPARGLERLLLDPTNPNIIYAEGDATGVFKSTNGGKSWKPINSGLADPSRVRGLLVDPTDSSTLYVGTTRGVFKTTNGGESWAPTGSRELIDDPQKPNAPKP